LSALAFVAPAFAGVDVKDLIVKHLKTSEDFSLQVAEAMPEADYSFKLTPPQMSFGEQLAHLTEAFDYFTASFAGEKPNPAKPPSMKKSDVIAYVKAGYEKTIATVSKVTPEQISKTYQSEEGKMTGFELLLGLMEHTAHHRACAEMYLRAKGITPPQYEF
jgi:uncharacterized damage-inducible protein DinB